MGESEKLQVETYSGYKADERPVRFTWKGRRYEVTNIVRRWQEPSQTCFRVLADDGRIYTLRQNRASAGTENEWEITS